MIIEKYTPLNGKLGIRYSYSMHATTLGYPPIPSRGDSTREVVYEAVGRALSNWEDVELDLACLYAAFLGIKPVDAIAQPEYVAARIFKERADVIVRAGDSHFVKNCDQAIEGEFKQLIIEARLLAERRNDIAHGVVRPVWSMKRPEIEHFMLMPSTYKHKFFTENANPLYAFSSKEINNFCTSFQEFRNRIFRLDRKISSRGRDHSS